LVLVMVGVGLRLDSTWQWSAWALLGSGSAMAAWDLGRGAFARTDERL
jgi:hypothetical protein